MPHLRPVADCHPAERQKLINPLIYVSSVSHQPGPIEAEQWAWWTIAWVDMHTFVYTSLKYKYFFNIG